jgi:phosphatidylglycerophosphate synthase
MDLVGLLALDGFEVEGAAPPEGSPDPFVRIAGVELVTRQVRVLLQGGADRVVVLPGRHAAALRALMARDVRLQGLALEVWDDDVQAALAALGHTRVLMAGPEAFFGPGLVRWARAFDGAARVTGARLCVGPAASLLVATPPEVAPPDERDAYVVSVTDRSVVRRAKQHIFRNVTKPTSGWVSKHINSLFSIPVSYAISELPITPNMVTVATTVVGLASAAFVAFGDPLNVAIGGLLFQLAAAMDRVDGEIARSKYQASENGAWIDTVGDNLTYLAFVVGITWGYYRATGGTWILATGAGLLVVLGLMLVAMYAYLKRFTQSGSLVAVTTDMEARLEHGQKPLVYRLLDRIRFAGKRDFFSLATCVVCAFGRIDVVFFGAMAVILGTIAYFASAARKAFGAREDAPQDGRGSLPPLTEESLRP